VQYYFYDSDSFDALLFFYNCRAALEDTVKIYDELRTDLDAAFPLVTKSVLASLVESQAVTRSVEGKCWQMLQRKFDEIFKKLNAEQKSQMEKQLKEQSRKCKVN